MSLSARESSLSEKHQHDSREDRCSVSKKIRKYNIRNVPDMNIGEEERTADGLGRQKGVLADASSQLFVPFDVQPVQKLSDDRDANYQWDTTFASMMEDIRAFHLFFFFRIPARSYFSPSIDLARKFFRSRLKMKPILPTPSRKSTAVSEKRHDAMEKE